MGCLDNDPISTILKWAYRDPPGFCYDVLKSQCLLLLPMILKDRDLTRIINENRFYVRTVKKTYTSLTLRED